MGQKTNYRFMRLSALEKLFADETPMNRPECTRLTALRGETVSFQVAYTMDAPISSFARVTVQSPLAERVRIRQVVHVPCEYPAHLEVDDNYLRTAPGLFPDLLSDLQEGRVLFVAGQWRTLWVDVEIDEATPAGTFTVKLEFADFHTGSSLGEITQELTVYEVMLPEQTLLHTEWFHGDCLAQYYGVEVFSEEHWRIVGNFITAAAKRGCNMILTPQFTPPLDTAKGYERKTIQLVDVRLEQGQYQFGFDRLKRWIDLCRDAGITHFELSHLFTQWGATSAPKVMATVDGEVRRLFGWDTPAVGGAYTAFLQVYLPELTAKLREWDVADRAWFHISDEPSLEQLDSYRAAKESVEGLLEGFVFMDALSDYDFYKSGAVPKPVCCNDHIEPFLQNGVSNMWTYYCTAQHLEVSNRFYSMPSARNRIFGTQLFKYDIEGILHWGYNFYNAHESVFPIDPYRETAVSAHYPGGDGYLVYPKADGTAEESIRLMVLYHGLSDLRALQLLASRIGKAAVLELLEGGLDAELTFRSYPKSDSWLLSMRNRVNELLNQTR